jgi:hypothetical protein
VLQLHFIKGCVLGVIPVRTHRDRNTGYSCGTVVYTESSVHPVDASTLHTVALVDDLNLMLLASDSSAPVETTSLAA